MLVARMQSISETFLIFSQFFSFLSFIFLSFLDKNFFFSSFFSLHFFPPFSLLLGLFGSFGFVGLFGVCSNRKAYQLSLQMPILPPSTDRRFKQQFFVFPSLIFLTKKFFVSKLIRKKKIIFFFFSLFIFRNVAYYVPSI